MQQLRPTLEQKLKEKRVMILEKPFSDDYQVIAGVGATWEAAEDRFLNYIEERKITSIFGLKPETVKDKYRVSAGGYIGGLTIIK